MKKQTIEQAYQIARERYAALGVDTDKAMEALGKISISLHCWQADDVTGFENQGGSLTGGIQVTGNYPGRARNIEELRADILKAASLIPGHHRLNLHEIYGEFGGEKVDRNQLDPMGKRKRNETGLQLHVVLPSQKRRLDLGQSGQKHPGLLDRTHQTLPGDQSSHGIGTG